MSFKCDCGSDLIFVSFGPTLDRYDNKILIECFYTCSECGNDYSINEEIEMEKGNN